MHTSLFVSDLKFNFIYFSLVWNYVTLCNHDCNERQIGILGNWEIEIW